MALDAPWPGIVLETANSGDRRGRCKQAMVARFSSTWTAIKKCLMVFDVSESINPLKLSFSPIEIKCVIDLLL